MKQHQTYHPQFYYTSILKVLTWLLLIMLTPELIHAQRNFKSTKKVEIKKQSQEIKKKGITISQKGLASQNLEWTDCLDDMEIPFNTKLTICNSGDDCREGLNYSTGPLQLPTNMIDRKFGFYWTTDRVNIDGVIWQVSKNPYSCTTVLNPSGLIRSGVDNNIAKRDNKTWGLFSIDFNSFAGSGINMAHVQLKPVGLSKKKTAKIIEKNNAMLAAKLVDMSALAEPVHYYIRIIPTINGEAVMGCSNIVILKFDDSVTESEFEIVMPPEKIHPDIFDIKIKDFTPIIFPTIKWGSMYVTGFDENQYKKVKSNPTVAPLRAIYEEKQKNNSPLIPDSYKGVGSDNWIESLWNAATSTTSWVSDSYEWLKDQVVSVVATLASELPLVDCNDDCKAALKAGLEVGMMAMGLPPSLPNAEQLLDEGFDYIAAQIASEVGCGELCEDVIREQMDLLGEQLTNQQRQMVANEAEAHNHGVEPMNIPAWVKVKMAPEAGIQPPKLIIELDRKKLNIPNTNFEDYFISIGFSCTNKAYKKGKSMLVEVNTNYRDGYISSYEHERLKLPKKPVSALWEGKLFPVPIIEPGRKLKIPISLTNISYLLPGHLKLIRKHGGHIWYDDWSKMYMNGDLTVTVRVVVKEIEPISWNTTYRVLSEDTKKYKLPKEFNGGYRQRQRIQ